MGDSLPCLHCSTEILKVRHFMPGQCPATRNLVGDHEALAEAVRAFLEDTDDETKDLDFLWAAWKRFKGEEP